VELKWAGTREEQAVIDSAMKISKDMKEMTVVDIGGSGHELTQNVNCIRNIRMSYAKIDKVADKVMIASGIRKRDTICVTKMSRAMISETCMIKKIMIVLSLGEIVAVRCGSDLYPKKVAKETQVRHVKLLTKTSLIKGNIVWIIPRDEHIIHIEKNKGTTTGWSMRKKNKIMPTSNKSSSNDNQGESLKPSMRGLFETIERIVETTNMALKNKVGKRFMQVDLHMQLTVKKSILHVKLRDGPLMNRSHHNKSMNGGPLSNRSKNLLIVTTILLLGMNNITIGGRLKKRDCWTWRLSKHRGRRCGR
jgi:hypothetical protein